jgi:hypothetical protein
MKASHAVIDTHDGYTWVKGAEPFSESAAKEDARNAWQLAP